MPDSICLLHTSSDEAVARQVSTYLQSEGISCGENYDADGWSILLLILSQSASDSDEILQQVKSAIAANKILIPFRIENFRPSGEMQDNLRWRYVHEAFSPPLHKHLEELVRMIKPLLHGRSARLSEATSISRTLPSRSAILRQPAKPESGTPSGEPVRVSLNFPHLILSGFPTTLQCWVENLGPKALSHLKILVECGGLKQPVERTLSELPAHGRQNLVLEIEPGGFGQFNLHVNLQWQLDERVTSYSSSHLLRIHAAPAANEFPDILQRFSPGSGSTSVSQGDRIELPPLIASADELSRFRLPDHIELLDMALDYEASAESVQRALAYVPLTIPSAFLGQAQTGSLLQLTPIEPTSDDPYQDIRLVARPQFILGRSGDESDFVLWFWPRNEVHDTKTRRISKKHVTLALEGNRLVIINNAAGSLTTYEGQDVPPSGIEIQRRGLLNLSGIYLLDVLHVSRTRASPPIKNLRDWSGRPLDVAPTRRRGCVRLSPRTAQVLPQNSTFLLSEATFGRSKINPIVLGSPGITDIQGRFSHEHGVFWLESFTADSAIVLNRNSLTPGSIAPLGSGMVLQLGSTAYTVSVSV